MGAVQQKQEARAVVFRSNSRELAISFTPETYGLGEGPNYLRDANKQVVLDPESRKPMFERLPFQDADFRRNGSYGVFEVTDPEVIERMRIHPCNKANGGGEFWEEAASLTQALSGGTSVFLETPHGGVTAEDVQLLSELENLKSIPPPAMNSVGRKFSTVLDRFGVMGISVPPAEKGQRLLKARITEFLSAIEDAGIWGEGIAQAPIRKESSGGEPD